MSIDNINIDKLRSLVELMEEKNLQDIEVSSGDESVKLSRYFAPSPTLVAQTPIINQTTQDAISEPVQPSGKVESSPMVGVFYAAPSPNDPPFVTVGQKVQAGDTLGIIEAMKIMNPLEATQSGIIAEILVDNSAVVEFGQPIIRYQS